MNEEIVITILNAFADAIRSAVPYKLEADRTEQRMLTIAGSLEKTAEGIRREARERDERTAELISRGCSK